MKSSTSSLHGAAFAGFLVVIGSGSTTSAGPMAGCTGAPPSRLLVSVLNPVPPAMIELDQASMRQLNQEAKSAHPLAQGERKLLIDLQVDRTTVASSEGMHCAAPKFINLKIGFPPPYLFITSLAARDACAKRTLLEHEEMHLHAERVLLNNELEAARGELMRGLKSLKNVAPSLSAPEAADAFSVAAWRMVREIEGRIRVKLAASVDAIDNAAALTLLRNACDGTIKRLETELLGEDSPI